MRLRPFAILASVAACCLLAFLAGCETSAPPKSSAEKEKAHEHDHEGHDHEGHEKEHAKEEKGHEHGPNGGELVELGDEYHIEWDRDDKSGTATFYLLDKDAKNLADADVSEITIESKIGEKTNSYTLPRVSSSETAKSVKFELSDKALVTSLLAESAANTLKIKIGDKTLETKIKHNPEHDHH